MNRNRLTRRTFAAGTALALPFSQGTSAVVAPTPGATPASGSGTGLTFARNILALSPDELLNRLESEPFNAPWVSLPGQFSAQPFESLDEIPFAEGALGAVLIVRGNGEGDSNEQTLGAYVVFPPSGETTANIATFVSQTQANSDYPEQTPLTFAGLEGATLFNDDGEAESALVVGNVLLLSTDVILQDGARVHPEPAIIRSTYYMVALLDHLRVITRPED